MSIYCNITYGHSFDGKIQHYASAMQYNDDNNVIVKGEIKSNRNITIIVFVQPDLRHSG